MSPYKGFVVVLAFLITLIMLIFVFPAFKDMFAQQDKALPLITSMMINAGDFLKEFWYTIPLFIIAFVLFVIVIFKWQPSRKFIDKMVLKIPLLSNLILYSNYSNFLSVISVSYEAGIPIVDCLHLANITLTKPTTNLSYYTMQIILKKRKSVRNSNTLFFIFLNCAESSISTLKFKK